MEMEKKGDGSNTHNSSQRQDGGREGGWLKSKKDDD